MGGRGFLLHHPLDRAVEQAPDRIAVECGDRRATYAALSGRADAIAALLQSVGVTRGDLVGVCVRKSVDVVAMWLGVLRAGAAYVPMDAGWPPDRVRAVVERGRLRALVIDAARGADLAVPPDVAVIAECAAPGWPLSLDDAAGTPRVVAGCDLDPAYVYFTSGSTGRPKGVVISHRAARSYLEIADGILGVGGDDVVANHAPLAFDLASLDVHLAIRGAARLSLIPEAVTLAPGSLLRFFADRAPTVLYTVPTTLSRLAALGSIGAAEFASLRALVFAGEPPNVIALRTLRRVFPAATFHHWYGSTEAALVTAAAFPPGAELPDPMPIGRPVANVTVALRGDDDRIAPVEGGGVGELLVSATLLLDGYAHEPELTAAAFAVEEAAAGVPRRWFRTRDRVRAEPDGALFYLGREDGMVKVRGFRV